METTSLAELGLEAIETLTRDVVRDAETIVAARRRLDDAISKLDRNLKDEVIQARTRELRTEAEKAAAKQLAERDTHQKLEQIFADEAHFASELVLSRARFTRARGNDDDVVREATAALATATTVAKMTEAELRLTLHDSIRRQHWATAWSVVREARHRAEQVPPGTLTDPAPAHTLATELGEQLAKASPIAPKAKIVFGRAHAAMIVIRNELRLIGKGVPPPAP